MIVCSCPLHDNRNGVDVCTCLCQEHDRFFDQGVVLVRQAVRRYQRVAQGEITGVHNRLNAVNQLYDTVSADLSRLRQEVRNVAEDLNSRMAGIERSQSSVWPRLRGVEEELMSVQERLSPPDKAVGSRANDAPIEGRGNLPPDMWDRYGVRWKCKGRVPTERGTSDLIWESVQRPPGAQYIGTERTVTRTAIELEHRGPFTSKSPLAEDQPEEGNSSWQGPVLREDGTVYNESAAEYVEGYEARNAAAWERGKETDGDLLALLGTDAVKWAEDFVRSVSAHDDDYEVDQVLTWFAAAIEAGRSAGYDQQRRDSFLYNVATCGECSATSKRADLCQHHRAMIVLAREEAHGQ